MYKNKKRLVHSSFNTSAKLFRDIAKKCIMNKTVLTVEEKRFRTSITCCLPIETPDCLIIDAKILDIRPNIKARIKSDVNTKNEVDMLQ